MRRTEKNRKPTKKFNWKLMTNKQKCIFASRILVVFHLRQDHQKSDLFFALLDRKYSFVGNASLGYCFWLSDLNGGDWSLPHSMHTHACISDCIEDNKNRQQWRKMWEHYNDADAVPFCVKAAQKLNKQTVATVIMNWNVLTECACAMRTHRLHSELAAICSSVPSV